MIPNALKRSAMLILFLVAVRSSADYIELAITPIEQETNENCWAACVEMVLIAYGNSSINQETITIDHGNPDLSGSANRILTALRDYEPYILSAAYA